MTRPNTADDADDDARATPSHAPASRAPATSSWFDGLSDKLRETASIVGSRLDEFDENLDAFARRALGDEDDGEDGGDGDEDANASAVSSSSRVEFSSDDVDALREALSIAKQELAARDASLAMAREETAKMREAAIKAAKELAKRVKAEKASKAERGVQDDGERGASLASDAASSATFSDELARSREVERVREEMNGELERARAEAVRASEEVMEARERLASTETTTSKRLDEARAEAEAQNAKAQKELAELRAEVLALKTKEASSGGGGGGGGRGGKKGKKGGGGASPNVASSSKDAEELAALKTQFAAVESELASTKESLRGTREVLDAAKTSSSGDAEVRAGVVEALNAEISKVKIECEKLRSAADDARSALDAEKKARADDVERIRAEVADAAQSSVGEDVQAAEARAAAAETRAQQLKGELAEANESRASARRELDGALDCVRRADAEMAQIKDELTDAIAAKEDMEGAVTRGAVSAANSAAKMNAAEKAKAKAEAELAEIREQLRLMDATSREAAESIAAREKAELVSKRAVAQLALAEKTAEEAQAAADKAAREGEERNRRFAHVQAQFQVTEKELREKIDTVEAELKTLRANADEATQMKADAESIVAEAQEEADETKAQLDALTERAERMAKALEAAEAEALEARTRLTVLEEMAALRKSQPAPEPARAPPPTEPVATQTEAALEASASAASAASETHIRRRLASIINQLNANAERPTARTSVDGTKSSSSIWGMLGMGSDDDIDDDDKAREADEPGAFVSTPIDDSVDLDALFDRVETLARDATASQSVQRSTQPSSAPAPADADVDARYERETLEELSALKAELSALKAGLGERSTASLAAVNRRAQEAELAAADAKTKLAAVEKTNRELSWQISMLTEQDEKQLRPVLASSGWLARATGAVSGCTAPRRQRSVLLQQHP